MPAFARTFLALSAFTFVLSAPAQVDTAVVSGTVHDPSGAAVASSHVSLRNTGTGVIFETKANGTGEYQFSVVPIGTYQVTVESTGFTPLTTAPFHLDVAQRERVDAQLHLVSDTQSVTVSADTIAVLDSDTSDRGQVIGQREITGLPLNGRNYADLALLAPGVSRSGLENQTNTSRDAAFNVNGVRSTLNNFLLDGLDNNSYSFDNNGYSNQATQVSPDGLAEFKLETDNYSAEFGRAGGGIVNAATRSGTDKLHGTAWEYLRNTYVDARGPFAVSGQAPTLNQNQFGGAVGGKILPARLFFFADYEGLRRVSHSALTSTLPTAAQRAGTFVDTTGKAIPVRNPYTGTVYSTGQLPAGAFTPLASLVLAALPLPNADGFSSNYTIFPAARYTGNKGDGRLDYFLNSRLSFFGRYSQNNVLIYDPPPIPGSAGGYSKGDLNILLKQVAFGANWVTSPRSTVDFRFGWTSSHSNTLPPGFGQPSLLVAAGIPNLPVDPNVAGTLNSQQPSTFSKLGRDPSVPTIVNPMTFNYAANYAVLAGRHSLKAGVSSIAINTDIANFHPQYGTDTYKGLFSQPSTTKAPSGTAGTPYKEAWALADFIYGARDTYELSTQHFAAYRQRIYGAYLQDDWRASEHLVINAGLRYEIGTPQYEANNQLANFSPATGTLVNASSGSLYSRSLQDVQYNNLAPRFGLAYSAGRNVLRAGYAISYIQFNRTNSVGELASNAPFTIDSLQSQIAPVSTGGQALCTAAATACFNPTQLGYPSTFIAPGSFNPLLNQVIYRPRSTPTGYVQSYQLSVQRELPFQFLLDVAYVGNHGVHELLETDYNQAAPNAPGAALTLQARRPLSGFSGVQAVIDAGTSNYNAVQAKLERRLRGGLYLLNSFTYGRSYDLSAGPSENVGNSDSAYANIRNLAGDYARSSFDLPLLDTFSANWDLPFGYGRRFGKNSAWFTDLLLGGWTLTTITSHSSGVPFNIVYTPGSQAQQVSSLISYRPNTVGPLYLGAPVRTSTAFSVLDPAAVAAPALNQPFGNLSRNAGRGLAYNSTDLGVHKAFSLSRDNVRNLEFRAEAFNLFNHVNWGLPDSNINDAAYGQITSALPARQLQGALRLNF